MQLKRSKFFFLWHIHRFTDTDKKKPFSLTNHGTAIITLTINFIQTLMFLKRNRHAIIQRLFFELQTLVVYPLANMNLTPHIRIRRAPKEHHDDMKQENTRFPQNLSNNAS